MLRLSSMLVGLAFVASSDSLLRAGDGMVPKAEYDTAKEKKKIDFEQKLGTVLPVEVPFVDENGEPTNLARCINGKPTVLVLGYFGCPHLCGEVFAGVLDVMIRTRDLTCGRDFNTVIVSIDYKEKPGLAMAKKRSFVTEYGRKEADYGWRFLTGTKENIAELANAAGFSFEWDPMMKAYNHPSGIMILTPTGKVSRYLPGIEFLDRNSFGELTEDSTRTFRLSLVEAGQGQIGSLADRAFLTCFAYSPHDGKYSFSVMVVLRIAGLLTLLSVAAVYGIKCWRYPGARALVVCVVGFSLFVPVAMFTRMGKWEFVGTFTGVSVTVALLGWIAWRSAKRGRGDEVSMDHLATVDGGNPGQKFGEA